MSKKQNCVSLSIAEVEYIAIGSCCAQLHWMKKLPHDFFNPQEMMMAYCDNTNSITYQKILFNIQGLSTLRFGIISFEIWWKER